VVLREEADAVVAQARDLVARVDEAHALWDLERVATEAGEAGPRGDDDVGEALAVDAVHDRAGVLRAELRRVPAAGEQGQHLATGQVMLLQLLHAARRG